MYICMYVPEVEMQLPLYGVQILQPFRDISQTSRYLNLAQWAVGFVIGKGYITSCMYVCMICTVYKKS